MGDEQRLLHDPRRERDACGIGLVADVRGRASRELLDRALAGLAAVAHRGAWAADGVTGDGAGVLLPLTTTITGTPGAGLAMCFLGEVWLRLAVEDACRAEGLEPAGWRTVPIRTSALGVTALASLPRIEQLLLAPCGDDAERRAYRARRRAERVPGVYVASLSFRTVTYKALCAASQLARFYEDLEDPALAVSFAIFHQRFSTNTDPSWQRAQPFRMLCHNGEINTIDGNVSWLEARESALGAEPALAPALDREGSDSALLDNALELLVRDRRKDLAEAVSLLVPPAWQNDPRLSPEIRDLHRYGALVSEPWDGPAALCFSDGRISGAALDRNGLRPLRVAVTDDGLVAAASEAGAVPLPEGRRVRRLRLGPGGILTIDQERGLLVDGEVREELARRRPYGEWVRLSTIRASVGDPIHPSQQSLQARQVLHGYTREDLNSMLRPLAQTAHDPVYSMGDDSAIAPLAGRARPLTTYLRQRFAQVTNPAIDHLRERLVMSVTTFLGPRPAALEVEGPLAEIVVLPGFLLNPSALDALEPVYLDATFARDDGLAHALDRLAALAESAVATGATLVSLSDRDAGGRRAPVPALLGLSAVHSRLAEAGLRMRCSLLVDSDEPRDTHAIACLLGYGADAICPRLALETVARLAEDDRIGGDRPSPADAERRLLAAFEEGVLKVMSKVGISDIASYRGARLFEAVGLDRHLCREYLAGTPSSLGGAGLERFEREALERLAASQEARPQLDNPGYFKFRKGGEAHATDPDVVAALQDAVTEAHALRKALRDGRSDLYERYAALVNERQPLEPRDLLELVPAGPAVPLEEVEPASEIVRRFSGGAMSHGALSAEAHETIAIALNRLGARANSGEGGEDPDRFRDERNCKIKQVASGRFGVTAEYAVFAEELQIKIAQGSKPGEGGQIPAHKVTEEIARLRRTQPGVSLISPPPHHDIYSIEDLAQLIFDLREVNPEAAISVKLVAESGVGIIAAGVAKAHADVIHVAGADGGTGASPLPSIKHAGAPWEVGLAETQQALMVNHLRGRVRVRVDGGFKTGRDVLVAALLGADEFSFGTSLLLAEGCLMVRSCHLDTCPVGIATQQPELRAKFAGTPEMVEAYLLFVAEEVRRLLAQLGVRSLEEVIGHVECLRQRRTGDAAADSLDLGALLGRSVDGPSRFTGKRYAHPGDRLGALLLAQGRDAVREPALIEPRHLITNGDRAVGARLAGAVARSAGSGPPAGRVRVRFEGVAGQSFGAFLTRGLRLELVGEANDYVGKSMSGGRIVVSPPPDDAGDPCLLGNTALYGATGGALFCAGSAGERFAVRNSGAVAVVEGVGDHACEYMTAGTVVILGNVGLNLSAGMTGGEAYVLGDEETLAVALNGDLVVAEAPTGSQLDEVRDLVERHLRYTASARAASLLARWEEEVARLLRIAPRTEGVAAVVAVDDTASEAS